MKSSQVKSFDAVGRELDRRAHTYANDVDQSGRHIGYRCRAEDERPVPLERAVERRMGELKTKRKVRENQVRAMGFIVSSNDALDEKSAREFLDRSINWFGARYGYENLLAAQIHLDEGTPHAHIWIAPVIHDRETGFDRLCAKELFAPDKRRKNAEGKWEVTAQGTMSRLQEDFWEQVAKPYGYERPLRHELRAKGYRSLDAYKVQVGTTRALKSEIETLEGARDKAKHSAVTAKRELDGLER
ncbi:MobV family relaxase, partial [Bacteroides caccae]